MNKKLLFTLCLYAGILNGVPAAALSETEPGTHLSDAAAASATEEIAAPDALEAVASETIISDPGSATADIETATESLNLPPDPFAADPFAGISLSRMKRRLLSLATTATIMQETCNAALTVTADRSSDRFFRRSCELLTRLNRFLPVQALASMLVMPEFIAIADELTTRSTRSAFNISVEEARQNPKLRLNRLKKLQKMNEVVGEIAELQSKAAHKVNVLLEQLDRISSQRTVSTPPADLLKKSGNHIRQLLSSWQKQWIGLLNQHNRHRVFLDGQLQYLIAAGNEIPAVRQAVHMNLMIRSLLDFKLILEKYYANLAISPVKVSDWQKELHGELEKLSGKKLTGLDSSFPARDAETRQEPFFSTDSELQETFVLLERLAGMAAPEDLTASDSQAITDNSALLLEKLLPYIDGKPWQPVETASETFDAAQVSSSSSELVPTESTAASLSEPLETDVPESVE